MTWRTSQQSNPVVLWQRLRKKSRRAKAKPRSVEAKKSQPKKTSSNSGLYSANSPSLSAGKRHQRDSAHDRQGSRRSSGGARCHCRECAARLCDAKDAQIFRRWRTISFTVWRVTAIYPSRSNTRPITASRLPGARWSDRERVHIRDLRAVVDSEFPVIKDYARGIGHRTTLAVPLLRDGLSIGAILIRRLGSSPLHGNADQTARNLRRPGGDRHRECPAVSGT